MTQQDEPKANNQFNYYLGGLSSWWIGLGLQSVLIAFLVTFELQETPERIGIAQMFTMLPSLLLILVAGVVSDKYDCRGIALGLHLFAIIPPVAIALGIYMHYLNFELVLIYASLMSVLSAFNMPSRDALLNRVMTGDMQHAVSQATTAQFISQISGFIVAGFASFIGVIPLLILQALAMSIGGFFTYWIKPQQPTPPPAETGPKQSRWQSLKEGFIVVGRHPLMRIVSLLNILVGLFFMGCLMVGMPIIVRDIYDGDSTSISMCLMAFYAGIIAMSLMLSQSPPIKYIGKNITVALAFGSFLIILASFEISFYVFILLIFAWGATTGFVFTLGRTIVQEFAPATHRARALSVFQIGILGGAPIGSFAIGFLARSIGPLEALYIPAGIMLITLLIASFTTELLKVKITQD